MRRGALGPGRALGPWTVERWLGSGAMGDVWLVRPTAGDGPRRALKVLRLGSAQAQRRFAREGALLAAVQHPQLVAVAGALEVDGSPGLLLEWVDGPSLDRVLAAGPLREAEALALFEAITLGVAALHGAGIVHRDLKPSNVLLALGPDGVSAKVADFGVARALDDDRLTARGAALGTAAYMAPEQRLDAGAADRRADVFSLGALLVELLTGRPPWGDAEVHARGAPSLPDGRWGALARACLADDPADRPADARALADALGLGDHAPPLSGQLVWTARCLAPPTVSDGG